MNNTTGHAHDATAWLQLARRLQKQQLQQLSQLGELASQLSALVHMLQCERGASNIYLCSGGLLYTAECRAGGALVDERLALFYASLERARAVAGSALCWRIARAVDELAQLPALRAQIGRRQIAAEAATEQFSRVIRHLLNIAPQLNDSIDDPPVAGRL
ncbi:TPA: nitrate- and nitrite sensing domain-containing protein, partial [Klebsiella pneumoniae]